MPKKWWGWLPCSPALLCSYPFMQIRGDQVKAARLSRGLRVGRHQQKLSLTSPTLKERGGGGYVDPPPSPE